MNIKGKMTPDLVQVWFFSQCTGDFGSFKIKAYQNAPVESLEKHQKKLNQETFNKITD